MNARNNDIFFIFIFLFFLLISANATENAAIKAENGVTENNYNSTYCVVLLNGKEPGDSAPGIGGIRKFAWSIYGNNSHFSWISIPGGIYALKEYGCKGAQTTSAEMIPLEAENKNNFLYVYGIRMFNFPLKTLEKYIDVEEEHYILLNTSIKENHLIFSGACASKDDEKEIKWFSDTDVVFPDVKPRPMKERPEFSFKWNFDENDKKKILDYLGLHDHYYLFSWEDISGNNTDKVLKILEDNFGSEFHWMYNMNISNTEIKKINAEKINIADGDHYVLFTLKKDENKINVEIFGKYYEHPYNFEYFFKEESGMPTVYGKNEIKILKDKNNKDIFIVENGRPAYMVEKRENETVLRQCVVTLRSDINDFFDDAGKKYILDILGIFPKENKNESIEEELLDKNTLLIKRRVKFDENIGTIYHLATNDYANNVSFICEWYMDKSKFEVKNESGEIKVSEFENPYQYIDAFYNTEYKICFEYSDDGKEGKIKFENKTIDWKIEEGVENESCGNNTFKMGLKGGKDTKVFPFLITKNITKKENKTMNKTTIYGILIPCNLSKIHNLSVASYDKISKYTVDVLLQNGFSFSNMFKIMYVLYYEKIRFNGCNDEKNYTLSLKFSDNFDKEGVTKVMITKILPEEEPYRNGKIECIEKEMKC